MVCRACLAMVALAQPLTPRWQHQFPSTEAAMKARAVSYGAVELKQMEHRYMAAGLTISVAIHLCMIAAYILKGLVTYDGPPGLPPLPTHHSRPDWRQVEIIPILTPPTHPFIPHGGSKHGEGKFAIPVPVPIAPTNEDTLLFKRGDPGPGGDSGMEGEPGNGGEGPGDGPGMSEVEPPPFVPVEKEPVPIKIVDAIYPELAVRAGLEGKVWVKIWVDREGKAHKAEVLKSTSEIFNEAALAAAMQFNFVPAYMNGGPVAVWVSIPFTFRLKQ